MKQFKIRASAAGSIMGVKGLGGTGETYLQTWVKEQLYNRRKEFDSKYTEKGNIMEQDSIDAVCDVLGLGILLKNDDSFEDEYFKGTPDVVLPEMIIDVKSSWDCFTFPLFDTEVPNTDYYWQAQIYMHLTGRKHYKLCYVLTDTPIHLIEKEAHWKAIDNGMDEDEVFKSLRDKMTYSDVPDALKIKIFDIEYNEADVNKLIDRVKQCRQYIETLQS